MNRYRNWAIGLIWACFLARGAYYSAMFPLWEGWDEWSHFAYLQHFASTGKLPVPGVSRPSREIEASMRLVPLAWTIRHHAFGVSSHDLYWKLSKEERDSLQQRLLALPAKWQREPALEADPIYQAQQPPLYYWLLYPPLLAVEHLPIPSRVFWLRLASVFLASLAVPLGYAASRRVLGSDAVAAGAIALVTLVPGVMINVARVGNDSLCLLLYTALLCVALRIVEDGPDRRWCLIAGLLLGCGLLTKAFFLAAPPAMLIVLAIAWRGRPVRWPQAALSSALVLLSPALLAAWWYRFIYSATGTWTGQLQAVEARSAGLWEKLGAVFQVRWNRVFDAILISHVWFGASSFLQVRSWMYHFIAWVGAISLCGLLVLLLRKKQAEGKRDPGYRAVPVLMVFFGLFLGSVLYHALVTFLTTGLSMTNGWYLYCVVFPEVLLLLVGLMALVPGDWRKWIIPHGMIAVVALDWFGMHARLLPYYLGLIAHEADGHLQTFHLSDISRTGLAEVLLRLETNRPYLGNWKIFATLWAVYILATVVCLGIGIAVSFQPNLVSRAAMPDLNLSTKPRT